LHCLAELIRWQWRSAAGRGKRSSSPQLPTPQASRSRFLSPASYCFLPVFFPGSGFGHFPTAVLTQTTKPFPQAFSLLRSVSISLGLTFAPIFLVAIAGVVSLLWDRQVRNHAGFVIALLLFSFVAVSIAEFYFDKHPFSGMEAG